MAALTGATVTFLEHVSGPKSRMSNALIIGRKHVMLNIKTSDAPLFVVAHELVNGSVVLITLDPKAQGSSRKASIRLLTNAYDKDESVPPFAQWLAAGKGRYIHKKEFPAVLRRVGLQLPDTAYQNKPGTPQILTEKNLAGYRRNQVQNQDLDQDPDISYSRRSQAETPAFKEWFGDWQAVANATPERQARTLDDAMGMAREFVGAPLKNQATSMSATVSNTNLAKMGSRKAGDKSVTMQDHAMAIANIDKLFAHALLNNSQEDSKGEPTIRAIHRFMAPMFGANGDPVLVKMTIKETTGPREPNPVYSVEAMEIENPPSVLARENPN